MAARKSFPDIAAAAWEHPADTAALAAVKQIPALDDVLKKIISYTTEKSLRLIALASSVRVTERQFARLNHLLDEACRILDVAQAPELFVSQSPLLNAGAVGVDRPFISLNSAIIAQFSDEEMLAVIAHELGHIQSGHVLYKTLLWLLLTISADIVPVSKLVLSGIIAVLKEWDRKSELSADRAGLLVTQDPAVSFRVLMKIAGGANEGEMSLEEFFIQADEYEKGGDMIDSVHKLLNVLDESHPFAVLRLKELKVWRDSGAYEKVLGGDYPRRSERKNEDVRKTFDRAAGSYRDDFERTEDPLAGALRDIGKKVEAAGAAFGKQAEDLLRGVFGAGAANPFSAFGGFGPGAKKSDGTEEGKEEPPKERDATPGHEETGNED